MFPSGTLVDRLISLALDEDLSSGDVTSRCSIPSGHRSHARIIARQALVFCGGPLLNRIAELAGATVRWHSLAGEGQEVRDGERVAEAEGDTQELLALERVSLNFLQRLSGVATFTASVTSQAPGMVVLDTRKTTPGWRLLEKYSTRIGGAHNHRSNLGDLILIKNNHIDAHGGDVDSLFTQIQQERPWHMPVECEVRSLQELRSVLSHRPDFILLDNMSDGEIEASLSFLVEAGYQDCVEVSGGVTPDRLRALAALGVRAVSMGSLTTQAVSVDISMRLTPVA